MAKILFHTSVFGLGSPVAALLLHPSFFGSLPLGANL